MKRLKFSPELVSTVFDLKYQKNPSQINYGLCMKWAYIAYHMFEGVELWDTCGHAFVRYHGKFYDSEVLDGVVDWRELPANHDGDLNCAANVGSRVAVHRSVKYFEKWWAENNHVKPDWKLYQQSAKDAIRKYATHSL